MELICWTAFKLICWTAFRMVPKLQLGRTRYIRINAIGLALRREDSDVMT